MGIAALALLAVLGCGDGGSTPEPLPAGPSCERAYEALSRSLEALHADAGKPAPTRPDRAAWMKACADLALDPGALRCLEPTVATAESGACAEILGGIDREPLDRPFLDAMLSDQGASP